MDIKLAFEALAKHTETNPVISAESVRTAGVLFKALEPFENIKLASIVTQKNTNILFLHVESDVQSITYEIDNDHIQWEAYI